MMDNKLPMDSAKMQALEKLKELAMELMGEHLKSKHPDQGALDVKIAMLKPDGLPEDESHEDPREEAIESPADELQEENSEYPGQEDAEQSDIEKLKQLLSKK